MPNPDPPAVEGDEIVVENDEEVSAINACVRYLRVLNVEQLQRVLGYLRERFETEDD